MNVFRKFINTITASLRNEATPGTDYEKYSSTKSGYQTFRTGQDCTGRQKKNLWQRWKRRFSRSGMLPVNDFKKGSAGKRGGSVFILRGLVTVAVLVSLAYVERGDVLDFISGIKYFHIQEMEIEGCRLTTPAVIREMGGFTYGTSLFSIGPKETELLLKNHSWISEASIKRQWPDRLVVTVTEYVPAALITQRETGNDELYYVDIKGICFSPVRAGEDVDFPVITGLNSMGQGQERKKALAEALHFLKLAKRNNPNLPAQLVSEINFDETEGMVIYLVEHPFPIYFGRDDVKKKYKQLRKVLEILYEKQKNQMKITQVKYIRMEYLTNKVLVAQSGSG